MNFNQVSKCLLLTALLVLLSACGVDEGESNVGNSQTQQVTLSADNAVDSITNGLESYISLEDKVHATSSIGDNTVSEVVLLSDQPACRDIDVYPSGYSVNTIGYIGTCVYEYSVENTVDSTARAVAYSTAVVQENTTGSVGQFEPIAEVAEASESLDINLADKLAGQIPDGYALSETITNLGVGSATLNIVTETITFISDEPGYSQIIYSYANETEVKIGSINIAVSSDLNTAPVAPNIDYSADINNEKVNINTEVIIDVGSYISDPDDEPLQLVYVDSWYASVTPLDLNDESNTAFTFITDRAGEHFVTYAISDHNGGYDIGQVRIEVYDPNSVASWGNIQQGLQLFYGPLTHAEAFGQGIMDTSTNFDQNRTVSTFNYVDAKKSCESKGGLPSEAQLQELYDLSKPQSQGWPVALSYWSSDVNKVVSLSNKQSSAPVGSDTYYVTCINEVGFVIDNEQSFTSDVVANGGSTNEGIAKVVVKLTFNQQPVSGAVINASVSGTTLAQLDESSVTTDEDGIATFKVTDIKAETVAFTAEYDGEERNINITFIGDKNAANLTTVVTVNDAFLNGGFNEITATLKDTFGNGLEGEVVTFSSSDPVSIISNNPTVDKNGLQTANIQWVGNLELTESQTVTVTSSYTQPDTMLVSSNVDMTFSNIVFNGLSIITNFQSYVGEPNKVRATVLYGNGAPAVGIPVSFSTSGCSTVSGNQVYTNSSGWADMLLTSTAAGNCSVTATAVGKSDSVTVTFYQPRPFWVESNEIFQDYDHSVAYGAVYPKESGVDLLLYTDDDSRCTFNHEAATQDGTNLILTTDVSGQTDAFIVEREPLVRCVVWSRIIGGPSSTNDLINFYGD